MGSLFEELEAREVAARVRVEELEAEVAELAGKLELAREWSCPGLTDTDGLAGYAADGTRLIDVSTVCRRSYSAGLR
jgi:hypothetical protein